MNNWVKIRSIRIRIMLWAGLCLLVTAAGIIAYASTTLYQSKINEAKNLARSETEQQIGEIEAKIDDSLSIARTLAESLVAMKTQGMQISRSQVNLMLKEILIRNEQLVGSDVFWEPNLDGLDALYAGKHETGNTVSGRFAPYWTRSSGNIELQALKDEEAATATWYLIPQQTLRESIIPPLNYEVQGEPISMTSLMVPMTDTGHFYGVAGVDMPLTFLQKWADQVQIYNGEGKVMLVANDHTIAAATGHKEWIGASVLSPISPTIHPEWQTNGYLTQFDQGTYSSTLSNGQLQLFIPVEFGKTGTHWTAYVTIPESTITREAAAATTIMVGLSLALTALALTALWFAAQLITNPIQQMTRLAQTVAEGDLRHEIPLNSADEIGQLAEAFRRMTSHLRHLIQQINENAQNVSSAAQQLMAAADQANLATSQVSSTLQQVAQGTSQQAENVTEVAASINEFNGTIQGIAKGAQDQAIAINKSVTMTMQISQAIQEIANSAGIGVHTSTQTAQTARAGAEIVTETIQGIENIRTRVDLSAQKVREMEKHSEQIGAIIETIEDIASQTNLLALNAAIEAAHAGEHGKGFAVVATAVRELAEKSAEATKEIAMLVRGVQKTAAQAAQAMDESSTEVTLGVTRAGRAAQALSQILNAVTEVHHQTESIAAATQKMDTLSLQLVGMMETVSTVVEENSASTEQMSANATEITQNIETIAGIAEENSASTEEVAATIEEVNAQSQEVMTAAQSLTAMAHTLQQLIDQFTLPETAPKTSRHFYRGPRSRSERRAVSGPVPRPEI